MNLERKLGVTLFHSHSNLVPRVLWLFGQRVGARRDSGELEFQLPQDSRGKTMYVAANQRITRVSPGDQPLAKEHEDSGNKIVMS